MSVDIPRSAISSLLKDGATRIDLSTYMAQVEEVLQSGCARYVHSLSRVFASQSNRFDDTTFRVELDPHALASAKERRFRRRTGSEERTLLSLRKEPGNSDLNVSLLVSTRESWPAELIQDVISFWISELLFDELFPRAFIASAERTGAAMFRSELDDARNRLRGDTRPSQDTDPQLDLFSDERPIYPLPVNVNIDFIRKLERTTKEVSYIAKNHAHLLAEFSDIVGGDYVVTDNGTIHFIPAQGGLALTMDESSSAVRSLLILGFYLRHLATRGDLLIVDEPELNLHPRNQRRIARLFARLVNLGIRVFATTHSDYIVKELNTLIMLNQDKPHLRRISSKERYRPEELLKPEQVSVYLAEPVETESKGELGRSHTLSRARINEDYGIEARSFDDTINQMNEIQDAILSGDDE